MRHGSNTSFIWTLVAGFKNAVRYGITGDHIDAQEALRIGIVNKVVPHDQLLDECFSIVERIALVPPETVKINLAIATMGLEMMGLRDALYMGSQLTASNSAMLQGGVPSAPGHSPAGGGASRLSANEGRPVHP